MNVKKNHSFQSFSTAVIIIIIINSCNLIRLVKRESRFHYTDRKYCAFIRRRNWNEKKKKKKTRLLANCNYFWTLLLLLTRYNTSKRSMIFTEIVRARWPVVIKILSTLLPNYRLTLSDLYRPISLTVELRGHRVAPRNMCHVVS